MGAVPEVLLQRAIIQGFRAIRKDSRLLDDLFVNLSQKQTEAIKAFVLETPIDFAINFPRKEPTLPSLNLVLKSETESQAFLGDVLGDRTNLMIPDPELSYDTLGGHAASVSGLSGLPVKVAGPLNVASQTSSNSITFTPDSNITELVKNLLANPTGCLKLYITDGAGEGEVYDIARLREDGLDIIGTFDPQLDDTSVVDIRKPDDPELAVGEPSRVYAFDGSFLSKGVYYDANYNLHVLTAKQDQVIFLYAVVKALLLSQREFLESQGLINLQIGGSDFAPRSEFLPDEVFQRVMTIKFVSPFTFLQEQETFSQIQVNLRPDGSDEDIVIGPFTL